MDEAETETWVVNRLKMSSSEPEASDCLSVKTDHSMDPPIVFKQQACDRIKLERRESESSGFVSMKTDQSKEHPFGFTGDTSHMLKTETSESVSDCLSVGADKPTEEDSPHRFKTETSESVSDCLSGEANKPTEQDSSHRLNFKLLLAGDVAVGKTCLLERFVNDRYKIPHFTVGFDFQRKTVELSGNKCLLTIFDMSGLEKYSTVTTQLYRGMHGFIVVYDVTKQDSFHNLKTWLWDIETRCDNNVFKVLVGNKTDLSSCTEVDRTAAQDLASKHEMPFIETSALKGEGVDEAFLTVIRAIMKHRGLDQLQPAQTDKKKCLVS